MKREIFWRDYISFLGYNFNTNQLPANVIFSDVWKSAKCVSIFLSQKLSEANISQLCVTSEKISTRAQRRF